ncbi:MAG: hypothetical protein A2845_04055 [Candidatus Lloydbacteria bacterium RIFCSPHIGHO2_01_FULL_49_22]|uniref:Uncharacterized protein n=1 Tax=Candidatus Lloydbacteria bacterium RIFCSPHIGHO2_01_FULL_49_22 TaxID=1798658 RepID=A0A1G2CXD3_9BACT|nr:MAG: hypothetical protein A2845_04055 [Candidatus Lloydbacteria bacterium RIFCSPHIGHO2_01_FULL_49_22]OGZ09100.1 MAG: hypothetical protein A3C14_03890 [Candidatus Lloydbacteria bacterium RIFCSPHIGHO2_02_FULL_50_18]
MAKVTAEHVKQGAFIWYSGTTSMSRWSCPAVITRVDNEARLFYVRSFDDMLEQSQAYEFDVTEHSPDSRENMRLATLEEVGVYLDKQEESLIEHVSMTRRVRKESTLTLHRFREERDKLFPDHLKE